jgi:hypothetical protein
MFNEEVAAVIVVFKPSIALENDAFVRSSRFLLVQCSLGFRTRARLSLRYPELAVKRLSVVGTDHLCGGTFAKVIHILKYLRRYRIRTTFIP